MKHSAGIVAFRRNGTGVEVLLLHPAGPYWANKNFWHFPQGELDEGEEILEAARREFLEEVGVEVPDGKLIALGEAQRPGKMYSMWALESYIDLSKFPETLISNMFTMEWPPKSGKQQEFPENDRAEWFLLDEAHDRIFVYLQPFIQRLAEHLGMKLNEPQPEPTQISLL